jgi:hypothetical protein
MSIETDFPNLPATVYTKSRTDHAWLARDVDSHDLSSHQPLSTMSCIGDTVGAIGKQFLRSLAERNPHI